VHHIETPNHIINIDGIDFPLLIEDDNRQLDSDFEEVETKEAVNLFGTFKSSGANRFNINFIKNNWETIK